MNVAEVLEHANSTQKIFGHNKLHNDIENLSNELNKMKLSDKEKETKLKLKII